jgi:hypothetical protein
LPIEPQGLCAVSLMLKQGLSGSVKKYFLLDLFFLHQKQWQAACPVMDKSEARPR